MVQNIFLFNNLDYLFMIAKAHQSYIVFFSQCMHISTCVLLNSRGFEVFIGGKTNPLLRLTDEFHICNFLWTKRKEFAVTASDVMATVPQSIKRQRTLPATIQTVKDWRFSDSAQIDSNYNKWSPGFARSIRVSSLCAHLPVLCLFRACSPGRCVRWIPLSGSQQFLCPSFITHARFETRQLTATPGSPAKLPHSSRSRSSIHSCARLVKYIAKERQTETGQTPDRREQCNAKHMNPCWGWNKRNEKMLIYFFFSLFHEQIIVNIYSGPFNVHAGRSWLQKYICCRAELLLSSSAPTQFFFFDSLSQFLSISLYPFLPPSLSHSLLLVVVFFSLSFFFFF